MGFLILFVELLKIEVNLANLLASLITIFICYFLNAKLVFEGGRYSRKKEAFAFFSFSIFGLVLNVVLMYLMTTFLPIWYAISKTLIVVFIAVFNFIVRKNFIFLK
ncbi:GtrA family protein [uncultured Zobellia sp.]|uniref:GtrA family protein n=1 Tax=uncultured Zobellia sp. TaxID=255433 RepID=UPI0033903CC6